MAGSFIFSKQDVFTLSQYGFYAIVDRIRAAASAEEAEKFAEIVRPTDESFDFLLLNESISPQAFQAFYRVAAREFERCSESNIASQMLAKYYDGIMDAWTELLQRMRADSQADGSGRAAP